MVLFLAVSQAIPQRLHVVEVERNSFSVRAAMRPSMVVGEGRLKSWRIFRRARCSPNRMTSIAKAVLTLERHR